MKKHYLISLLFSTLCLFIVHASYAQNTHNHEGEDHHEGLHFVHPLFTESVSPDTKMRLDYQFQNPGSVSENELEGEYAFSRIFSLEAGVHFDPEAGSLGNTHMLFKFANYALEEQNILLGYGLSLDLPTGSGHGHGAEESGGHHHDENIYQFSPFFNAGIKAGDLEVVGWTLFNIPTNQAHPEESTTSLDYHFSALYHLTSRIQPLVELTGARPLSGISEEAYPLHLAPGVRIRLLEDTPLVLGLGLRLPVTSERNYDTQFQASAFLHF